MEELANSMEHTIEKASKRPSNKFNYDEFMEIQDKTGEQEEATGRNIQQALPQPTLPDDKNSQLLKRGSRSVCQLEKEKEEQMNESSVLVNYDDRCGMIGKETNQALNLRGQAGHHQSIRQTGIEVHLSSSESDLTEKKLQDHDRLVEPDFDFQSMTSISKMQKDLRSEGNHFREQGTISNYSNINQLTAKAPTSKTSSYKEDKKFIEDNFMGIKDNFVFPKKLEFESVHQKNPQLETISEAAGSLDHTAVKHRNSLGINNLESSRFNIKNSQDVEVHLGELDLNLAQVVLQEYLEEKVELEDRLAYLNKKIEILSANKKLAMLRLPEKIQAKSRKSSQEKDSSNNSRYKDVSQDVNNQSIKMIDQAAKPNSNAPVLSGKFTFVGQEKPERIPSNMEVILEEESQLNSPKKTKNENKSMRKSPNQHSDSPKPKHAISRGVSISPTRVYDDIMKPAPADIQFSSQTASLIPSKLAQSISKGDSPLRKNQHITDTFNNKPSQKITKFTVRQAAIDTRHQSVDNQKSIESHTAAKKKSSSIPKIISPYINYPSNHKTLAKITKNVTMPYKGYPKVRPGRPSAIRSIANRRIVLRDRSKDSTDESCVDFRSDCKDSTHVYGLTVFLA